MQINVIGGGLAGSEAAWQVAKRGERVVLYESRPLKMTPAHKTSFFAELVCSNSLKSKELHHPHGILKKELEMLGSIVMESARFASLKGGKALIVDRKVFSEYITSKIEKNENIEVRREEVKEIPEGISIIATGPLTHKDFADELKNYLGENFLYFYDAVSPIISSDSLNMGKIFKGDRFGLDDSYLNAPMTEYEYKRFYEELINAEIHEPKEFEKIPYFEGCLPIEVMAKRGYETLRWGPLRPDGFEYMNFKERPYAIVQLRPENKERTMYSLVGFQTQLKIKEQERIFRMIPGLENAEFLRYGKVHRNIYINSPKLLNPDLSLKKNPDLFFAGQITGTEGYVEAAAGGIVAGINAFLRKSRGATLVFPRNTAIGALINYIVSADFENFSPMNVNLGLFEEIPKFKDKMEKRRYVAQRALKEMEKFVSENFADLKEEVKNA